jgi:hypothetical protein
LPFSHPAGQALVPEEVTVPVAIAELAVALLALSGRAVTATAAATTSLGIGFVVWTLVGGATLKAEHQPCGCFGPLRASFGMHLAAASLVLALGGLQFVMISPTDNARSKSDSAS